MPQLRYINLSGVSVVLAPIHHVILAQKGWAAPVSTDPSLLRPLISPNETITSVRLRWQTPLQQKVKCKPFAQAQASFSAPGARAREIIMSGVIRLGPQAQLWRRRSNSCVCVGGVGGGGGRVEAGRGISEALCSTYRNYALPPHPEPIFAASSVPLSQSQAPS